jgi:hypothetical protein
MIRQVPVLLSTAVALMGARPGGPVVASGWRLDLVGRRVDLPFPGTQQTASAVFDINGDGTTTSC